MNDRFKQGERVVVVTTEGLGICGTVVGESDALRNCLVIQLDQSRRPIMRLQKRD